MLPPPGPVKISHKKMAVQKRPHRFHVSRPPYPPAGSATAGVTNISQHVRLLIQAHIYLANPYHVQSYLVLTSQRVYEAKATVSIVKFVWTQKKVINSDDKKRPVADLHGQILDATPHLGPISSIFTQFSRNFGPIIGWRLLVNPESTTGNQETQHQCLG